MAAPKKRGNGWTARYQGPRGPDGKRVQLRIPTQPTKKLAEDALRIAQAEVARGEAPSRERLHLSEYLDRWLAWVKERVAERTWHSYEAECRLHLKPGLGHVWLHTLSAMQIEQYLTQAREQRRKGKWNADPGEAKKLSDRSIHYQHRILSMALRRAVIWRLIPRNPCEEVEPPRVRAAKPGHLSPGQLLEVLEQLKGDWLYLPAMLAAFAGLRRGEVCGLQWRDLDLDAGALVVSRSIAVLPGGATKVVVPKHESDGAVAIPATLVQALKLARLEATAPDGWVVPGENGEYCHPNTITGRWARWARRHGVKLTFHGFRHTQGTLMVKAGVHPLVSKSQLRHSSMAMVEHYGHVLSEAQIDAARRVDELLKGAGNGGSEGPE